MIYGLTFIIGFFVAGIIWVLYETLTAGKSPKAIRRDPFSDLKRLRQRKIKLHK
jgi:hypothetical protein